MSYSIDDYLAKLQKVLDNALTQGKTELNVSKISLKKAVVEVQKSTRAVLIETGKGYPAEIDGLKAQAKRAGVNADECFGEQEKTLITLPQLIADDVDEWANEFFQTVFDDADEMLTEVS